MLPGLILPPRTVSPVCVPEADISDLPQPTAERQAHYLPLALPSCVSAALWASVFPLWKMGKTVIPASVKPVRFKQIHRCKKFLTVPDSQHSLLVFVLVVVLR